MNILPGSTLGLLGGGQLGRFFVMSAHDLGYRTVILDPDPDSPAGQLASLHIQADYLDKTALDQMIDECDAISVEFENVPADALVYLEKNRPTHPSSTIIKIAQNRIHEKTFLSKNGFPVVDFAIIEEPRTLSKAFGKIGAPAILKQAESGYDGKGQQVIHSLNELKESFEQFGKTPCVLEQRVKLKTEISVIIACGIDNQHATYPVAENIHRQHILDVSIVPARVPDTIARRAQEIALNLAQKLKYRGVLAVEFFITEQGDLLINEIAPRPHNSGHYTLDACLCSQFEQQLRAMCALPLGTTQLLSPAVMVNLLGGLWLPKEPNWRELFAVPSASLHLYGKKTARSGRKMGHFTVLSENTASALTQAQNIKNTLLAPTDP